MPELTTETIRRVDASRGTATALPTDQEFSEYWRIANANAADAALILPDVPDHEWLAYVDESTEWARATFAAGTETWPQG